MNLRTNKNGKKKISISIVLIVALLITGCGKIKVENNNNEYTVDILSSIIKESVDANEEWQKGLTETEIKEGYADAQNKFWSKYDLKMGSSINVRGVFIKYNNEPNAQYVYMEGIEEGSFLSFTNDSSFAECESGDVIVISVDYFSEGSNSPFSNAKLIKN